MVEEVTMPDYKEQIEEILAEQHFGEDRQPAPGEFSDPLSEIQRHAMIMEFLQDANQELKKILKLYDGRAGL